MTIHVASLQDLADLVTELRKSTGMSYRTLAEDCGINPGTLLQMQHGRHWPLLNTVGRLMQWHGETVTIGWNPDEKENSKDDYSGGNRQQGR